jgi:hypothetical protein
VPTSLVISGRPWLARTDPFAQARDQSDRLRLASNPSCRRAAERQGQAVRGDGERKRGGSRPARAFTPALLVGPRAVRRLSSASGMAGNDARVSPRSLDRAGHGKRGFLGTYTPSARPVFCSPRSVHRRLASHK